jgi:hypothetical protein
MNGFFVLYLSFTDSSIVLAARLGMAETDWSYFVKPAPNKEYDALLTYLPIKSLTTVFLLQQAHSNSSEVSPLFDRLFAAGSPNGKTILGPVR